MAKISNDQVANDIKTAFEAMKTLFNVGSSSIKLDNSDDSGGAGGLPSMVGKNDNAPFCISVCGMSDLIGAIKTMKNSLGALQSSLVTLEYCLIILTVILSFAVVASTLGIIFYLVRISLMDNSKKKTEGNLKVATLQKKKKIETAETEMRETD